MQAGRIQRAQLQGIGIAHDSRAACKVHRSDEVVAGVGQCDVARAGID